MADRITEKRLREVAESSDNIWLSDFTKQVCAELLAARAEVERLRQEVTASEDLRAMQGKMLATLPPSANDLLLAEMGVAVANTERDAARAEVKRLLAELLEALKLLRAHGQAPSWLLSAGRFEAVKDWNRRYGELLARHKETP